MSNATHEIGTNRSTCSRKPRQTPRRRAAILLLQMLVLVDLTKYLLHRGWKVTLRTYAPDFANKSSGYRGPHEAGITYTEHQSHRRSLHDKDCDELLSIATRGSRARSLLHLQGQHRRPSRSARLMAVQHFEIWPTRIDAINEAYHMAIRDQSELRGTMCVYSSSDIFMLTCYQSTQRRPSLVRLSLIVLNQKVLNSRSKRIALRRCLG